MGQQCMILPKGNVLVIIWLSNRGAYAAQVRASVRPMSGNNHSAGRALRWSWAPHMAGGEHTRA